MTGFLGTGASDCEAIRDGLVAQPANTLSSLAYAGAGVWILWRVARGEVVRRDLGVAYGLALIGVGFGSVAFHGADGAAARFAHDFSIATVLLVVVAADLRSLGRSWAPAAAGAVAAALVLLVAPGAGNVVAGALIAVAVVLEVLVSRTGQPSSPRDRIASMVAVTALAVAGIAQLLGRTGAPLCDADSLWQAHALWHTLTALALAAWSIPLLDRAAAARSEVRPGRTG